jgi:hypothetical protein
MTRMTAESKGFRKQSLERTANNKKVETFRQQTLTSIVNSIVARE